MLAHARLGITCIRASQEFQRWLIVRLNLSNKSTAYSARRYFVPSAIPASQSVKSKRVRVRKHYLNTPLTYKIMLDDQARLVDQKLMSSRTAANRATALRGFLKSNCLRACLRSPE